MLGKLEPSALAEHIFERVGAADPSVLQGPAHGEDTAAIDLGEQILVVNADPLSLAADQVGRLAIQVVCNDLVASGARPRWVTNTMFLPDDNPETVETITRQIDETANALDVAIVGGHAEYFPTLDRPLLSLSAMGTTTEYIPSGGASAGDAVILTGGVALEGTAILATDFAESLVSAGVADDTIERAADLIEEIGVVDAGMILREAATGMHDPTEGGVLAGLVEMASAAGYRFEIDDDAMPIRDETKKLCEAVSVDPLRIFGSGSLLATIPPAHLDGVMDELENSGIEASVIGTVVAGEPGVTIDGIQFTEAPRDELYELWS